MTTFNIKFISIYIKINDLLIEMKKVVLIVMTPAAGLMRHSK